MSLAITAVAVGTAATIGSAYMGAQGAKSAANARADAINKMTSINVPEIQQMARTADTEKYKGTLDLQRQVDPALAKLRENSAQRLADLSGPQATDGLVDSISGQLYNENIDDAGTKALKQKLLADAQAQLDAGSTLPADFQAELVRTGLERAGATGVSSNPNGAAGRSTRQVLGAAGQALKQQRVQSALAEAGGASTLASSRAAILQNLIPTLNNIPAARMARAQAGFQTAQEALPNYGLSGIQTAGLELDRIKNENQKLAGLGDAQAQKSLADASFYSSAIGAVGSGLGAGLGAYNAGGAASGAAKTGGAANGYGTGKGMF